MTPRYVPALAVAVPPTTRAATAPRLRAWLMAIALAAPGAMAQQAAGTFEIPMGRTSTGGGKAAGGVFEAQSTIGDFGATQSGAAGGVFALQSGYQMAAGAAATAPADSIFGNGFD